MPSANKILGEEPRRLTIGDLRKVLNGIPVSKDGEGVDIIMAHTTKDEDGVAYLHKAVYSTSKQISSPGLVLVTGETFDY